MLTLINEYNLPEVFYSDCEIIKGNTDEDIDKCYFCRRYELCKDAWIEEQNKKLSASEVLEAVGKWKDSLNEHDEECIK